MKLGTASQIVMGVDDIDVSFLIFNKLGFKKIAEGREPRPWIQVSDGSVLILFTQDGKRYLKFSYFDKEMDQKALELEERGIALTERFDYGDRLITGDLLGPDNVAVGLINFDPTGLYQPHGKVLRTMSPEEINDPSTYPNKKIGIYSEISYPVTDLQRAIDFWQPLGFEPLSINDQPYPWAILGDDLNTMGFYQGSEFDRPAITYFAKDMRERIQNLKKEGIYNIRGFQTQEEEYAHGILSTPEGHQIFLFSF